MLGAAILWIGLGTVGAGEYLRPFGAKVLDQAALDVGGFGDKKSLVREDDGLRVTIKAGEPEAGWKTPPTLRVGGDFTISATLTMRKLPKPGQDDGVAVGLAISTQNIDQPQATLLREVEPDGKEVFRPVNQGENNPQAMMAVNRRQVFNPFGDPIVKANTPQRHTFPARGSLIRLEFRRQGSLVRYQVFDEVAALPREIGQFEIGPGDIAGVKLFASNRNGAEPVDVLFQDLSIRSDRITGLGTAIRSVFGTTIHGDPTAIDGDLLLIGGPTAGSTPDAANPTANPAATKPANPSPAALPAGAVIIAPVQPPGSEEEPAIDEPGDTEEAQDTKANPAQPPGQTTPAPSDGTKPNEARPAAKPNETKPATPQPPKARIPLNEVESITFERAATPTGRFQGQPNVDTTRPGGEAAKDEPKDAKVDKDKADAEKDKDKDAKKPVVDDLKALPPGTVPPPKVVKVEAKPNGIRDLHLSLSGLREAAIRQIMIQCPTDKGQAMWQLDTSGSQAWPLTLRRAGTETWADLFVEPPEGDCHDKQFMIQIMYADGQNANVPIKATAHTDSKLKFDPEAPAPALDARVYLAGDEQLYGKLESITEETLALTVPWGERLDVPMTRVVGVYMGMSDHKESPEAFARRLKSRGSEDQLLARAKDGEVVTISGVVQGSQTNKLTFAYQGKGRTLPLKQVEGFILATRPAPKPPTEVRMTFALTGGIVVSGRWVTIEAATWTVETLWGQTVKIPAADIQSVRTRGGQMTYLSDLDPSQVEESPYFGRRVPFRKDANLVGEPLRLDGQAIEKGLAVHSRTALTYDLDRRFATFEALVGFDEAGKKRGRVDCRVLADGKEIYGNPDLRADADPVKLSLPVAGAEQIQLIIDFGPDEDTGDRVIWANARLYRQTAPADLPPLKPAPESSTPKPSEQPKPTTDRPVTPTPPATH